ncbi:MULTISPECIES: thermostable hemolysin [Actinokineospora]|uniref:Thermostable hemolysin n=1 Tax=Actinokineospora fastidiosa TaxID=1816 RepID=A0A918LCI6_9PSEU|nr:MULTISPECIES: thermostable hemolysin [Actinokineospora]UVS79664.1 Thermostable hemolysin [Actinokineospora sp. UTMC 2448]GGS30147.1 thermostable hemolysin [Actinokineospora fastidiosa]
MHLRARLDSAVAAGSEPAPMDFRIGLAKPGSASYAHCAELVRRKYLKRYDAVVDPRPDLFVVARDSARRRTMGCAGITSAVGRKLLSENYLDRPVERVCADLWDAEPDRAPIAEMGPLASFYPGCGLFLMRRLPTIAIHLGYDFVLTTLTERLHGLAKAAGWAGRTLANARSAELAGFRPGDWGTYYAARPRTVLLHCRQTVGASDEQGAE